MIGRASAVAPLWNRQFSLYWLAGLASNCGWMIQIVTASWLMTSIGGTPELVALVQTAMSLPIMLFALPSGAIADALGRRCSILWAQSLLLPVSLGLAIFAYMDILTPWTLLLFVFLISTCKAMNGPAWLTAVSEIMPRDALPAAIAMNSVGFNIARSIGPAVGGGIIVAVGAFAAFALSAISNVGMLLVALGWHSPATERPLPAEPVGAAMLDGVRYVAFSARLLVVIARAVCFNFAAVSVMALMPLIAQDLLLGGPQIYGFLLGSFGAGAVVGALNFGRMQSLLSSEWLVRTGSLIFAAMTVAIACSPWTMLTLFAAAIAGACWLMVMSTFSTTVQMSSPRWVLSRCQAIYQGAFFGANAIGSVIWGIGAGQLGTPSALVASALVLIATALFGLLLPLRPFDNAEIEADAVERLSAVNAEMARTSWPILTSVVYRIDKDDVPAFLAAMQERRQHRIRDGARRWTLSRDLRDPDRWVERYMTRTWIEHERLLTRRTVAGAKVVDQLGVLHRGRDRPDTHHEIVWSVAASLHSDSETPVGIDQ